MRNLIAAFALVAMFAAPSVAGDDKAKTTEAEQVETKKRAPVMKAVGVKAIDKVGGDGIIEKGAKAKVITK